MLRAKNAQQRIADPLPECPAKQSDEASLAVLRAGLYAGWELVFRPPTTAAD